MKKQYDYYETPFWSYEVILYHDGKEIDRVKKKGNELDSYLGRLAAHGFTRGYSPEAISNAHKKYLHMYDNQIVAEPKDTVEDAGGWLLECRLTELPTICYWSGLDIQDGPLFTEYIELAKRFKTSEDAISTGLILLQEREIIEYKVYYYKENI